MNQDLNDLLRDWPHEPGQIKARKIVGSDGSEKVQLRIDLGLIQMEINGRPDGKKPHGCESLLVHHQVRAREKEGADSKYRLSPEDCSEMQQEGIQYYHRYISLFQLNDYAGVIRDTQRNLDMFSFVAKHVERDDIIASFEQFKPYVLMMNTRAKAAIELERDDFAAAERQIQRGLEKIRDYFGKIHNPEMAANSPEISFLEEWLEEIRAKRPLSKLEVMQKEMESAIAREAYERAAELRDAIKAYRKSE
ncbi:MAG: UvrB/UvrC motif-containing protein [Verrucomicrobiota bacterium]